MNLSFYDYIISLYKEIFNLFITFFGDVLLTLYKVFYIIILKKQEDSNNVKI